MNKKHPNKLYKYGKNRVAQEVNIYQEKEYLEVLNKLMMEEKFHNETKKQNAKLLEKQNKLLDRLNEIDEVLDEILQIGLLDYVSINLIKDGE